MALLQVQFNSCALKMATSMNVILPQPVTYPNPSEPKRYPVLYLLHGLSDDHSIWLRRTSVERYAASREIIVVMPTTHRGFYTNTYSGQAYFDFIAQELPAACAAFFPVSGRREDTFAAGLSMGGYGALKLGLTLPRQYAAVASMSGVVDVAGFAGNMDPELTREMAFVFGPAENLPGSENDLCALADRLIAAGESVPQIYQCCGTEDFLYQNNREFFEKYGKALGIHYEEGPGVHSWDYWDAAIQRVLDWLPLKDTQ